jgi:hypothetical protein
LTTAETYAQSRARFNSEEKLKMKKTGLWLAGLCVFALLLTVVTVHAAPQNNANVAGTWQITMAPPPGGGGGGGGGGQGGGTPPTLTLKQDGAKVTGTMSGRGGDTPIEGSVSGNTLTFTITRQGRDGNSMTLTYTGTVSSDGMSMTGKVSGGRGGDRDFTAKKQM